MILPTAALPGAPARAADKIVINFDAQGSTPTPKDAKLQAGAPRRVAFRQVADAYTKLHPNVQINFISLPQTVGRDEWLQARMLAHDAPDVFWQNFDNAWNNVSKGWYMDMDPYLKLKNPYAPEFKTWADSFVPGILDRVRAPDARIYEIPADGTGVLMVYNQDIFKKVGITVPKTWDEWMAANAKLQKAGYIPFGASLDAKDCCTAPWLDTLILGQLIANKLPRWDDNHGYIDTAEVVRHVQKGDWPPKDIVREAFTLQKQLAAYFPKGYAGKVDYRQLFVQQKVAMYLEGAWAVTTLRAQKPPFKWSWFGFPTITKTTTPLASGSPMRIFGPWGAEQWFIPGYLAQSNPSKVTAIIDFLHYASAPAQIAKISGESSFVPNIKGAPVDPGQRPFIEDKSPLIVIQHYEATLTTRFGNDMLSLVQAYVPGHMSLDQFMDQMQQAYKRGVAEELKLHPEWKVK